MQMLSFCYFHCRLGYAHQFHQWSYVTQGIVCLLCILLSVSFTVREQKIWEQAQVFQDALSPTLKKKASNICFSFAVGYVKPWFKHTECNISNAIEGTEIMAYLGGCIVYCVEVDLNCVGTSQENLQSKCKSYRAEQAPALLSEAADTKLSKSDSSTSFYLLLLLSKYS